MLFPSDMRSIIKRFIHPFLKWRYHWRQRKPRPYSYKGISIIVYPHVFSPESTISTEILVDFIENLPLADKKVLELGAGSGLVSFFSIHHGAEVTASDISEMAIEGLTKNASALAVPLQVVHSDLFDTIEGTFDYIFINPPYYPKNPTSTADKAWYCGEKFEYFDHLFNQLKSRPLEDEYVVMILSEDCDLETINRLALKHYLQLELVAEQTKWGEKNRIFRLNAY